MHTLEPELRTLHSEGVFDDAAAARALARDRGQVLSLHSELRATLYAGVLLVMAGVGIVLGRNMGRIGPLAIVLAVALVAVGCAVPAVRMKLAGRALTVTSDYLLLLAALLGSANLAYAERQRIGKSGGQHAPSDAEPAAESLAWHAASPRAVDAAAAPCARGARGFPR